jgi:uracil-DNA glycosylase family 4
MLVKTVGPVGSKMFFVGEAPGEVEDRTGRPFDNIKGAGKVFDLVLSQVGINRREVRIRNVALQRPPANDMSHYFHDSKCTIPKPEMVAWVESLRQELKANRPNVVVALGSYAIWALTGVKAIKGTRGYVTESTLVPGLKVVPTYHPQAINHDWKLFGPSVYDIRKAYQHSVSPKIPIDKTHIVAGAQYTMFMDYLSSILAKKKRLSVDLETHIGTAYPYLIGVADHASFGMSFWITKDNVPTVSTQEEAMLWRMLAEIGKACECIMHNACFDKSVLWHHHGVLFEKVTMDTLIAAHVLFPEYPRDLGFLGSILLDVPAWKNTSKADSATYNALDAIRTYAIADPLSKELDRQSQRHTFDFEMSLIDVASMLQLQGIACDNEKRKVMLAEKTAEAEAVNTELKTHFGRPINFNSPKQMQQLLYYDLGLPPQFKRRKSIEQTRILTADAKAVKRLAIKFPAHSWLTRILEYKKLVKLCQFLNETPSPTGRYHTSYNITGSVTEDEGRKSFGRWSSSASIILTYGSGNLQNIPPIARKIYVCDPGKIFVRADYKQAEAVVVAYVSGDVRLQHFFQQSALATTKEEADKYDVHKLTASLMFGVAYEDVTPDMRRIGKTLRHACSYSAGPQVIADQLGIELKDAKLLLDLYHRANSLLRAWYLVIQTELKQTRSLTNLLGRKHRFLDRWGDEMFRSAYSYIPQSTVGDLLNESMRILYDKYGDEIDIILQLHDAIYVQCPDNPEAIELTIERMKECMIRPLKYSYEEFAIQVDFETGYCWGELEKEEEYDILESGDEGAV